jgi:Thiamine monophosphate synthase
LGHLGRDAKLHPVNSDERRTALERARLYLICDAQRITRAPLEAIDVLQLRDKAASPADLLTAARCAAARCAEHGVLFIVNDHPQLARESQADGVHLGQDDTAAFVARMILGDGPLVGLSTASTTSALGRSTRRRRSPGVRLSDSTSSATPPPMPGFRSSRSAGSTPRTSPPSARPAPGGSPSSGRSPMPTIQPRPPAP